MTPAQAVDLGLRAGAYALTLDTLRANPHGVDLGALQEQLPARLFSADKQINLAPEIIINDLVHVEQLLANDTGGMLHLIGRRDVRDNNSWLHNSKRLMKGKTRCTLLINPTDAKLHGVADGEMVRVRSRVGSVTLPAQVSETMMQGVVSIPHGYGHARDGVQLAVATANAGVSVNDLTDDHLVDRVTGNAALNGVPVSIDTVTSRS
jgi:anaerobic selenocysteine-containing dehydrogenase